MNECGKKYIASLINEAAVADFTAPAFAKVGRWFWHLTDTDFNRVMNVFADYFPGCDCGDAERFRYASENHKRMFMCFVAQANGIGVDK